MAKCYATLSRKPSAQGHPLGVFVGSESGELTWFDPKTMRPVRSFVGHMNRVYGAIASKGKKAGKYLISSGGDGLINLWSLENVQPHHNVARLD